jgi:hypothetical protein
MGKSAKHILALDEPAIHVLVLSAENFSAAFSGGENSEKRHTLAVTHARLGFFHS